MRQHVVYILDLRMNLTFDRYVDGGGILVLLIFFICYLFDFCTKDSKRPSLNSYTFKVFCIQKKYLWKQPCCLVTVS